jgi:NAD(P)H dehydrogenase (quinone)
MTIGITGATGQLGRLVVTHLKTQTPARTIVGLVRTPAKGADLGIALRQADYAQPETLVPALTGIETLLLISGNEMGQWAAQHHNVIAAAKRAGVGRVVYTSLLRADISTLSLAAEHHATEQLLRASGLRYTILRNGWYIENYTGSIGGALAGGAFIGSAGDGKIAAAARQDYAEAAVVALLDAAHTGKTYELAGDTAFTLTELAAEMSRRAGRIIPYKDLPAEAYAAALTGFGLPAPVAQAIAGWDVEASRGALFDDGRQLSRLIGRPTTPLSTLVAASVERAA